jgi:hypothetical protein
VAVAPPLVGTRTTSGGTAGEAASDRKALRRGPTRVRHSSVIRHLPVRFERQHPINLIEPFAPVSDEQHGRLAGGSEHIRHEHEGRGGIEMGGWLVDHEHRRPREQRPSQDDTLPLTP